MCHEFRNSRPQKRKFDASSEIVTLAPVVAKVKVPVKVTIIVFNIKTNILAKRERRKIVFDICIQGKSSSPLCLLCQYSLSLGQKP